MAGCNNYGRALLHWDEIDNALKINERLGVSLLEKACSDQMQACTGAGYAYLKGIGVEQDLSKSHQLYEKACDSDDPVSQSCLRLGNSYKYGYGAQKSTIKANYYYQKACELGNEEAC